MVRSIMVIRSPDDFDGPRATNVGVAGDQGKLDAACGGANQGVERIPVEAQLVGRKEPSYRAKQIWQWLFQKRAASFAEMTNLSAALRARLPAGNSAFFRVVKP